MIFSPNDEQQLILQALERLTAPYKTPSPSELVQPWLCPPALRGALQDGGFLDIGVADTQSATASAMVVSEIARLPVATEVTGTALVRPAAFPTTEGPIALIHGDPLQPARFLPGARVACLVDDTTVRLLPIEPGDVIETGSFFAYPLGRLTPAALERAVPLDPALRETVLRWWRIGTALEIYGALDSAMALTLSHVRDRQQFGRPLGAFQAVQHRLAMSATAIQATRWLANAALFDAAAHPAMMALGYAQSTARSVAYDLHQFSGAMGLTLEYPLHLYTYRTKLLQSELGGGRRQYTGIADRLWSTAA